MAAKLVFTAQPKFDEVLASNSCDASRLQSGQPGTRACMRLTTTRTVPGVTGAAVTG